jgi:hypothetical protein
MESPTLRVDNPKGSLAIKERMEWKGREREERGNY